MEKKKLYKKPEITRVKMQPEDAVLTACKLQEQAGPNRTIWCNNRGRKCQARQSGS
jgi:hypothetical protein